MSVDGTHPLRKVPHDHWGHQLRDHAGECPDDRLVIGFCAPVDLHALARFCGADENGVPPGLGSTATTPLIIELLKRGHAVTLFTLSNELAQPVEFAWGRLRVFVERSRTFGAARNFFRLEIAALRQRMREVRPAFVHAHWTYEFALAARGSGVPVVVTIHDLPWRVLASFRDRSRVIRLLMAYAVALRCSRYTAVSEDAARHFARWLRPGARVEVIPNFVSSEILTLGEPFRRTRESTALACATVLQGWSRRKNGEAALAAFAEVRQTHPETRLRMFGRGFEADGPAAAWAGMHSLAEGVEFVGLLPYRELLQRLGEEVDVLIHPSLDEAFSMTIVEAMALRVPVVAGCRTPGVMEALDGGRAGMVVDVRRPETIAAGVTRLLDSSGLRSDLGARARARVLALYTAEVVVPQYEDVYRGLARVVREVVS